MINYPTKAQIEDRIYPINTDFKVALECEKIVKDNSISNEEKSLAIIYKLFGDKGLNNPNDWEKLSKIAVKFLSCRNEIETKNNKEPDMNFIQDEKYIKASFMSDYNIDLSKISLHWWDFFNLLNGLTEECILSRVRFIRNYDISQIKDSKEKQRWQEQKELVALEKTKKELSKEEKENVEMFLKLAGLDKEA